MGVPYPFATPAGLRKYPRALNRRFGLLPLVWTIWVFVGDEARRTVRYVLYGLGRHEVRKVRSVMGRDAETLWRLGAGVWLRRAGVFLGTAGGARHT